MIAHTEICTQHFPAHANYFINALNIWKSKNMEAYQYAIGYPDFKLIVSKARQEILDSYQDPIPGATIPKHLEECIGYADSIKNQ